MSVLEKFDPYAMINPKTPDDIHILLDEALSVSDDINRILNDIYEACSKDH